jgi:hypothetical protein
LIGSKDMSNDSWTGLLASMCVMNSMHAVVMEAVVETRITHHAFLADALHAAHPSAWVSLAVVADLHKLPHLQAQHHITCHM